MEFREGLKIAGRIHESVNGNCERCPIRTKREKDCGFYALETAKNLEDILAKWAKEHPEAGLDNEDLNAGKNRDS